MNGNEVSEYNCVGELSTDDIYNIALKFYKDNKDKAFHPTYNTRIKMSSLINYIKFGNYKNAKVSKDFGFFDLVGKDIQKEWDKLSKISIEDAQKEFVRTLEESCREFDGYLEAIFIEQYEAEKQKRDKELEEIERKKEEDKLQQEEEMKQRVFLENERRVEQENKLRALLNAQTLSQFREYAIQQHPDNDKEQERLIAQLQQHHFHQYMLTLYENSKKNRDPTDNPVINGSEDVLSSVHVLSSNNDCNQSTVKSQNDPHSNEQAKCNGSAVSSEVAVTIKPVTSSTEISETKDPVTNREGAWYTSDMVEMWVSNDINEFKSEFKDLSKQSNSSANSVSLVNSDSSSSSSDFILNINSGEVVTIQVPVTLSVLQGNSNSSGDQNDSFLVWQFATDHHDIGFGLSVSRTITNDNVTGTNENVETELLPVGRLDSHVHMHGGRLKLLSNTHTPINYPANQNEDESSLAVSYVFLLRFDNSYSLWRNKVLYYRICYSTN